MRRSVSDDGDMFKETKLLMYSSRRNHGYVRKTDIFYAKQMILQKLFAVQLCKYLKGKKTFCGTKFFLGTRFPSSTTISSSELSTHYMRLLTQPVRGGNSSSQLSPCWKLTTQLRLTTQPAGSWALVLLNPFRYGMGPFQPPLNENN